ncbi:unnamed protein product [Acanthoscelides obtectus]|uniref:Uncharacterized protein n=1 Tax=Acanthoscelides obtectus TaxID=200917 RepID=A0A9P0VV18_ACAOB|nr:unnamed protein product [Acanthoscelides obtectus]CAK1685677.1 hypothetical protein AOBTE_LOCUS35559 [Acanthoscelides obtectus]
MRHPRLSPRLSTALRLFIREAHLLPSFTRAQCSEPRRGYERIRYAAPAPQPEALLSTALRPLLREAHLLPSLPAPSAANRVVAYERIRYAAPAPQPRRCQPRYGSLLREAHTPVVTRAQCSRTESWRMKESDMRHPRLSPRRCQRVTALY